MEYWYNWISKAKVSYGHCTGRLLNKQYTFTAIQNEIYSLYHQVVDPILNRKQQYEYESKTHWSEPRSVVGAIVQAPIQTIADTYYWYSTPYPKISEEEETIIYQAFQEYKKVYLLLQQKYTESSKKQQINCFLMVHDKICSWFGPCLNLKHLIEEEQRIHKIVKWLKQHARKYKENEAISKNYEQFKAAMGQLVEATIPYVPAIVEGAITAAKYPSTP